MDRDSNKGLTGVLKHQRTLYLIGTLPKPSSKGLEASGNFYGSYLGLKEINALRLKRAGCSKNIGNLSLFLKDIFVAPLDLKEISGLRFKIKAHRCFKHIRTHCSSLKPKPFSKRALIDIQNTYCYLLILTMQYMWDDK